MTLPAMPLIGGSITVLLETKRDDQWLTKRYDFFTKIASDVTLGLTSHKDKDTLLSTSEVFTWAAHENIEEYRLELSSGPWKYQQTFPAEITSVTVDNIPGNSATITGKFIAIDSHGYTGTLRYRFKGAGHEAGVVSAIYRK